MKHKAYFFIIFLLMVVSFILIVYYRQFVKKQYVKRNYLSSITPTNTPTTTPTPTNTLISPTKKPIHSKSALISRSITPTRKNTPIPPTTSPTATPKSVLPSPTSTPRPTFTPTPTPTPTPGSTPTFTPTPTPTFTPTPSPSSNNAYSLRFFGTGQEDIDRVKIPVKKEQNISLPVNIGATDFTLEFWLRFNTGENTSGPCTEGVDKWTEGNIIFDRDIFGTPEYGDFGISLYGERIAFGVHNGDSGDTICSNTTLTADTWYHIAVTRRTTGEMTIFVNGHLDSTENGPPGDISYKVDRSITGNYTNEPFLVIGAEKHDYEPNIYPSFSGWVDEVRISNTIRYTSAFTPPTAPFTPDENTVGLYHFDEGSGTTVLDTSGAIGGPSHGERRVGGPNNGPIYDAATKPF